MEHENSNGFGGMFSRSLLVLSKFSLVRIDPWHLPLLTLANNTAS